MHNLTHFFTIDGNKYALDHRNIFFSLLDDATEDFLNAKLSDTTPPESPILEKLIKSGYFLSTRPDYTVPNFEYDTLNISFAPIHNCNFACTYCYADGGKSSENYKTAFDEEKIDKLLDYIYLDKYAHFNKYKFDFVSGGEPLLAFPILEYFLERVRNLDEKHDKSTTVLIVTNGTLLTAEKIKVLDNHDVFLGISIDGTEEVHNRHRVYRNGKGTYKDVVKGISLLQSSDVSSKLKEPWAMVVITKDTGSLVDAMENCIQLGFKRMQMQLMRESRKHPLAFQVSDVPQLKEHYKELFSHIINTVADGDLSRLKMIANDNDSFGKFLGRLLLRNPIFYRCFAGKNKISVTAGGEVYPCDSFCNTRQFCMGTIADAMNETEIVELFQKAHVQNRAKCAGCWARYICGGDCFYNSYLINGNIHDPDPIICEMNQFFIEHAIDMLIRLQQLNPGHIEYLAKILRLR